MKRFGLDFDNTIACYDTAFHAVAAAQGLLSPAPVLSKRDVKQIVVRGHGEDAWTRLQGFVYGPEIQQARPFPGVLAFLSEVTSQGGEVAVISHKTRYPVIGEAWDLHSFAQRWLLEQGFFETGLKAENVFFETTRDGKLARICQLGCQVFVDDLPEVLLEPGFPENTERWLFHPEALSGPWRQFGTWGVAINWLKTA